MADISRDTDDANLLTLTREAEEARREAEVERQANRAKSMFLANVSHEMRTPLNAVLGYAELLLTGGELTEAVADDVRHIADAGQTLLEIVNNLLDLSKVESGQFTVRRDLYETRRLVDELSSAVITRIKNKPVSFSAECSDNLPRYLYGDVVLVKQVIMNLLSNAAKYTNQGFITMRMLYAEGKLTAQVHDTGMGIQQSDIARIFNKFERLESNLDHSVEGTGLGLPLTKELVEQMGGTISVSSVFGAGSTFTVSIPQCPGCPPDDASCGSCAISAPGLRILLVDDNSVNLTVAQRLLQRFDLTVDCASSGEEGVAMAQENNYHCVLMDHMMPGMDGVEAMRRIKALPDHQEQLVFALTANAMKGMREFFLSNGFDDYMPKPITLASIGEKLRRWAPEHVIEQDFAPPEPEEIPPALSQCRGVDIDEAMNYTEKYADLLSLMSDFAGLIDIKSAQIESYADSGDVGAYTVEVHALKTSARLVGAVELSNLAAHLEQCGHEMNLYEIKKETPALLELYRSYGEKLRPAVEAKASSGPMVEISDSELRTELTKLRAMLIDFDLDGAEIWSDTASRYKLGGIRAEKISAIRASIQMIDYLGAIKITDELTEML